MEKTAQLYIVWMILRIQIEVFAFRKNDNVYITYNDNHNCENHHHRYNHDNEFNLDKKRWQNDDDEIFQLENGEPSRVRVPQGELMLLYLPQVVTIIILEWSSQYCNDHDHQIIGFRMIMIGVILRSGTQTEELLWSWVTTICRESSLRPVNQPVW